MATFADLQRVHKECCDRWLSITQRNGFGGFRSFRRVSELVHLASRWIHAIGIGPKIVNGKPTNKLCVRFYVPYKLPESILTARSILPTASELGVPIDVVPSSPAYFRGKKKGARKKKSGRSKARSSARNLTAHAATEAGTLPRQSKCRPITPGISAGHFDVTAGTIACFCKKRSAGSDGVFVLSNNHVFSNLDFAVSGDDLLQPGSIHGGTSADRFADFEQDVNLVLDDHSSNEVDAAIGRLVDGIPFDPKIPEIGKLEGTTSPAKLMQVSMYGSTSGLARGIVDDIAYTAVVGLDPGNPAVVARFVNQIRIQASDIATGGTFGLSGDSGSLVVEETTRKAVGLYFSGPDDGKYGVANRIQAVCDLLQIDLL